MTQSTLAILVAVIAAGSTILGVGIGALAQHLQTKQSQRFQAEQAEAARHHEAELRDTERREHRFLTLWGERRVLYATVLQAIDEHVQAVRDVATSDLVGTTSGVPASNRRTAREASPEAGRLIDTQVRLQQLVDEVALLGDSEVRWSLDNVNLLTIKAAKAAVTGDDALSPLRAAVRDLRGSMRRELVSAKDARHGTEPPSEPSQVQ